MKVKLSDICEINMGQSPSSDTYNQNREGLPFYQGNADFGEKNPIPRSWCREPKKVANINSILISVRAPIGAMNIATERCCIGRGLAAVIPNEEQCDLNYIWYALLSKHSELNSRGTGSTFKAIGKKTLFDLEIFLPSKDEQKEIALVLERVNELINLHKNQLNKLNLIVKSRFAEMFGNPFLNEKKWSIKKLGNLSQKITDGVHAKPNYTISGKPFISVVNITKGYVDFTDCKFVSEDDYKKMIKSTYPEKGDVLYTKVGATYGIPAYIDTDKEFCLYVSVCLIKPIHEVINSRFLSISMGMPYVKMQADRRIKGIGVPDLHLNQIREFDIISPPIELQRDFVQFVQQVDKSKSEVQKALEKTELLYKALMQQYFY